MSTENDTKEKAPHYSNDDVLKMMMDSYKKNHSFEYEGEKTGSKNDGVVDQLDDRYLFDGLCLRACTQKNNYAGLFQKPSGTERLLQSPRSLFPKDRHSHSFSKSQTNPFYIRVFSASIKTRRERTINMHIQ